MSGCTSHRADWPYCMLLSLGGVRGGVMKNGVFFGVAGKTSVYPCGKLLLLEVSCNFCSSLCFCL